MKRMLMSTISAAGIALSMIGAPLAMAQDQHPQGAEHPQGGQMAPHANEVHPTGPQHPVQHSSVEHTNDSHMAAHNTPPHQMTQVSHEQPHPAPPMHPAPPPMHPAAYSGHQWHNGDHYTGGRNYVSNWNSYHLSAPPSGYQWVQDGGQFVLIAVASGIIANVILNAAYQ